MTMRRPSLALTGTILVLTLAMGTGNARAQTATDETRDLPETLPTGTDAPRNPNDAEGTTGRTWTIEPRIRGSETMTDNVRLTTKDREADFITSISPGIRIEGKTRRLEASLDAEITYDRYVNTPGLNGHYYTVAGLANAELWEEHGYVDVRSSVNTQKISRTGAESATNRTQPSNQTQVFNNSVSPYLRQNFGTWADSEVRYRLSTTNFQSVTDETDTQPDDTLTNEFSFLLRSGPTFTSLQWSADASVSRTDYPDDRKIDEGTATLATEYALSRQIGLIAKVGYDSFDDSASAAPAERNPSWRLGTHLTPGPRTDFTVEGGERYGGTYYAGSLDYKFSDALRLTAKHDSQVTTQQRAVGNALTNATGTATDTTTGSAAQANDSEFDYTSQAYTTTTTSVTLSGERGRTSLDVNAEHEKREYGATGLDQTGDRTRDVYSLSVNVGRELTPLSEFAVRLGVSLSEEDGGTGDSVTARTGATYSYRLSESLTGSVSYDHYDRRNDVGTGYRENVVFVGLSKTF